MAEQQTLTQEGIIAEYKQCLANAGSVYENRQHCDLVEATQERDMARQRNDALRARGEAADRGTAEALASIHCTDALTNALNAQAKAEGINLADPNTVLTDPNSPFVKLYIKAQQYLQDKNVGQHPTCPVPISELGLLPRSNPTAASQSNSPAARAQTASAQTY